jgi:hypothetical protein
MINLENQGKGMISKCAHMLLFYTSITYSRFGKQFLKLSKALYFATSSIGNLISRETEGREGYYFQMLRVAICMASESYYNIIILL